VGVTIIIPDTKLFSEANVIKLLNSDEVTRVFSLKMIRIPPKVSILVSFIAPLTGSKFSALMPRAFRIAFSVCRERSSILVLYLAYENVIPFFTCLQ
jgi:hypothetical protein